MTDAQYEKGSNQLFNIDYLLGRRLICCSCHGGSNGRTTVS